jgi:alginate O-acetyltransferase complex protein AlgI
MLSQIYTILFFIGIAFLLYFVLKNTDYKWIALLIPSLALYYNYAGYWLLLFIVLSVYVYFAALFVESNDNTKNKWSYLFIIIGAFLPLLFFKLAEEFITHTATWKSMLGISFITFNCVSYLIDIKKRYLKAERNYFLLLLFMCFYPHILAGPLHKVKFLIPQLKNINVQAQNISLGCRLILWGFFKKYAISNNLQLTVDSIIDHPEKFNGLSLLFGGTVFFFQIYCDFSSYVDISQGIAQLFNIQLKTNFKDRIYASTSRQQFWSGWHITLNHWFRDYVFYKLAKNKKQQWQLDLITIFTFMLIGLWHSITFTFVLWGLLNGTWFIIEKYAKPHFEFIPLKIRNPLGFLYHVFICSFIALLFRGKSLSETMSSLTSFSTLNIKDISISTSAIIFFILMDFMYRKANDVRIDHYIGQQNTYVRWGLYLIFTLAIFSYEFKFGNQHYYYKF